jgi:hypothetical protein
MTQPASAIELYLEIGKKRTLAGALDWPGWCRSGRDEQTALQALFDSGPRYADVLSATRLGFQAPANRAVFAVVERLVGNATTDFGAPDIVPSRDKRPVDEAELQRFQTLLQAGWRAFDAAVRAAAGKELRKGPRGGGRDVEGIARHVQGAEASYLARLAWKYGNKSDADDLGAALDRTHQASLQALAAAAQGELPERGPRGGAIWPPRYFVRRVAWHVLDHLWEIESRSAGEIG